MKPVLLTISVVLLALAAAGAAVLNASLPRSDGRVELPGLSAPVDVELDRRRVGRLQAASLRDAFRAQGFVHAQDRYFQMDLTRRSTAGELAALFGEAALGLDRERRVFQFRERARILAERLPAEQLSWLRAYVEGVNAGLADLGARPPEYWLLRAEPEPWTVEDSLLVVYAFYTMLSSREAYERPQAVMRAVLSESVYAFLTPSTSRFDRPLINDDDDPGGGYRPVPVPPPADVGPQRPLPDRRIVAPPLIGAASNQWAVGSRRSASGDALLANDPHLRLRVPGVFHRSELYWDDGRARGVGIAGVPGIVIGASDTLAWGVTVSNADQSDWVVVETDPADPERYRVPEGTAAFETARETIAVRGRAEPETLEIRLTRWGPVAGEDGLGRPLALRATWLEPYAADLGVLELMRAGGVDEAIEVLAAWRGPSLNYALADSAGAVGWTVSGPLPRRVGFDGTAPVSWAEGGRGWRGWLTPPALIAADDGAVFTANNRMLPAEQAGALGRMWMRPFRAKRIAELLDARHRFAEPDFLAMQLDTRAEAYDLIRDVALEALAETDDDPLLAGARRHIEAWNGRADAGETGFRLLHEYYLALLNRLLSPLLAPALDADPGFVYRWPLADEPLRRLLEERPGHLLPEGIESWQVLLRSVLADTLRALENDDGDPYAPWGEANRLDVGHPFAELPLLGRLLRLPPVPQPGSPVSLRVAEPDRGAVIRMVVSPARPEDGILQMSGGQSGHFLSPHFRDQQRDWADGNPAPFLAGETVDRFTLEPSSGQ